MRVGLTGQELGGCFSLTLGAITPRQAPVIQEELQQRQIIHAEVPAEEEIAPQPAVDVLDQRAGSDRSAGQGSNGCVNVIKPAARLFSDRPLLSPSPRIALVTGVRR
jgi:hypothetical protein